jgi:phage terminase large subunit
MVASKPYLTTNYDKTNVSKDNRPYRAIGGALKAWQSGDRECLVSGPAGTGKSRGILQKIHFCAQKYPGMRAIMCRKTRKSLAQSAMVTYEKKVLPEGWLENKYVWFNTTDQQYEYVNGSIIAVGGMDDPSKIMSSEWDMIYPQEATELSQDDWQALVTRLRNDVMPYQQLIGDCNPSYPTHWLKQRCDRGDTRMILSKHADNPSLTQAYLKSLKTSLHGVMKLRLFDGVWAAAEGMVYDNWNPSIHIVSKKQLTQWGIFHDDGQLNRLKIQKIVAGADWGFTNPGSIGIYIIDNDDRMYMIREVYRTKRLIGWWVEQALALHREFIVDEWVCDPSEPAYIQDFCNAGLNAFGAINDIRPGVDAALERLDVRADGRAGFYMYEFALQDRDELRDNDHQPVCFENEINAYVWPQLKDGQPVKEVPVKLNDHSMDQWRYACKHLHVDNGVVELDSNVVTALSNYIGY